MNTQWQRYRKLELIANKPLPGRSSRSSFKLWFSHILSAFDYALFRDLEPRVWQTVDSQGQTRWHIYDPEDGQIITLNSEQEIRSWLDYVFHQP